MSAKCEACQNGTIVERNGEKNKATCRLNHETQTPKGKANQERDDLLLITGTFTNGCE
jgi:hypothetical protein